MKPRTLADALRRRVVSGAGEHAMKIPPAGDLLEIFESEPGVLDAGVAWANNTLTFQCDVPAGAVRVVLVPGYSEVAITNPNNK